MAKPKRQVPTNEPPRFYWEIWRDPGQGYIPYFWEELTSQAMILTASNDSGVPKLCTWRLDWPAPRSSTGTCDAARYRIGSAD